MSEKETAINKKSLAVLIALSSAALLVAIGALVMANQPQEISLKEVAGGCCAYYSAQEEPSRSIQSLTPAGSQQKELKAEEGKPPEGKSEETLETALKKIRIGRYDSHNNCVQAPSCGG
jgi:hypothetical protein